MKILVVCGTYPSSNSVGGIFIHNQVKALQLYGVEVAVAEVNIHSLRGNHHLGIIKDTFDGVLVYRVWFPCGPVRFLRDWLSPWVGQYTFSQVVKEFGMPNILHTHFSVTSLPAVAISKRYNIPMVLTEHSSSLLKANRKPRYEKLFVKTAAASKATLAVGSSLKDGLTLLTSQSIQVVPNIILSDFCIRQTIKYNCFTFISVGNLIASKRFDLTINAFEKVKRFVSRTQLIIVGQGPLEQELKQLANKLNVANDVCFVGQIDNHMLPELYGKCHCFVLPSMFETFGVVYAEAAACGLPLIATKCGGPEDIINTINGLLIEKNSVQALAEAMSYIYQNYAQYSASDISQNILNRFGEEVIIKQLIDIYKAIES